MFFSIRPEWVLRDHTTTSACYDSTHCYIHTVRNNIGMYFWILLFKIIAWFDLCSLRAFVLHYKFIIDVTIYDLIHKSVTSI